MVNDWVLNIKHFCFLLKFWETIIIVTFVTNTNNVILVRLVIMFFVFVHFRDENSVDPSTNLQCHSPSQQIITKMNNTNYVETEISTEFHIFFVYAYEYEWYGYCVHIIWHRIGNISLLFHSFQWKIHSLFASESSLFCQRET